MVFRIEEVQKDKQRSTKYTHKDRLTRNPIETGGERKCSGGVNSSCSISGTRSDNLLTNPVMSHECGKDRELLTTGGTYPWLFVAQIFLNGQWWRPQKIRSDDFNLIKWNP